MRNCGEGHERAKNTLSPSTRRTRKDAKNCNKLLVLFFARSLFLGALRVQTCFAPSAVLTARPTQKRQLYALSLALRNCGEGNERAKNTLSPSARRNREDAKDCKTLVLFFARSRFLGALRVQKCFARSAVLTARPRRKRQLYALSLARWNEAIAFAMGAGS